MSAALTIAPLDPAVILKRHAPDQADVALALFDEDELVPLAIHVEEMRSILAADNDKAPDNKTDEAALVALVGRAYKVEKAVTELKAERLKPLQVEEREVRGFFRIVFDEFIAKYGTNDGSAKKRLFAWRRLEADRIAREQQEALRKREEAARLQREAEQKAANAKSEGARQKALAAAEAASKAQQTAEITTPRDQTKGTKTEDGSVSYAGGGTWEVEILDLDSVPKEYWREAPVVEALTKVLKKHARAGLRQIAGCNVYQTEGLRRSAL